MIVEQIMELSAQHGVDLNTFRREGAYSFIGEPKTGLMIVASEYSVNMANERLIESCKEMQIELDLSTEATEKLNTFAGQMTTLSHYIDGENNSRDQMLLSTMRGALALLAEGKLNHANLTLRKQISSVNL
jgi:hypothetical protein